MRLLYNPKYLGNRRQAWKSFLCGSMVASSVIFVLVTDNPLFCIASLIVAFAGLVLFIRNNMNFTEAVYLFQNLLVAGAGLVVSIAFHVAGFLLLYLGIILVLAVVTWGQKYTTKGATPEDKEKREAEPPESAEKPKA
jgi:hypothetical protein